MTQVAVGHELALELFGIDTNGSVFRSTQNILDDRSWSDWAGFGGTLRSMLAPHSAPVATSPGGLSSPHGVPVNRTLRVSGGTPPYTWVVSGLPAGLSAGLSASAIVQVTGTPIGPATSTVSVTVVDFNGVPSGYTFTWTIAAPTTTVPNLIGVTQGQAKNALNAVGLELGTVSHVNNCIDPGTVVAQNPSAGVTAALGSDVRITISTCTDGGGGGGDPK
jgi:hypothetical protein